uniref:Uncharacterized protein n=1 Tax=Myoviridae sp. ctaOv25 TaxID=2827290 RepID=A0A8S5R6E4_9CAUD|nr:MAG TPA: hypothetical protein [Myoviridae sp. ctaOv25]
MIYYFRGKNKLLQAHADRHGRKGQNYAKSE